MQHRIRRPLLLRFPIWIWAVFASACLLGGCAGGSSTHVSVGGTIALTATNAAAAGGLAFHFTDGSLFGFSGQDLTLTLGADGATFTIATSRGTMVAGTLTFGSCTFTQTSAPTTTSTPLLVQTYTTCQVSGTSKDDIAFGGSGDGTLILSLAQGSNPLLSSEPLKVVYNVDTSGKITINMNTTAIGTTG
jgi:hypothetical protein